MGHTQNESLEQDGTGLCLRQAASFGFRIFSGVQCFQWAVFERLKVLWGHFQVSKSWLKMKIQKTTQDLRTLCFLPFV